jgi:hypothetical protein
LKADVLAVGDSETALRAHGELDKRLLGELPPQFALVLAIGTVIFLELLGLMRGGGRFSRPCQRCGRPVCRRCDPELARTSRKCGQCQSLSAGSRVVDASASIKKELEIRRYRTRLQRAAYLLGAVASGAGHLYLGRAVRGWLYLFVFLFCLTEILFRHGVVRAPYGAAPVWLTTLPAGLVLLAGYLVSLRGLRLLSTEQDHGA